MIDERVWNKALMRRNGMDDATGAGRSVFTPSDSPTLGGRSLEELRSRRNRPLARNAQLQVIGEWDKHLKRNRPAATQDAPREVLKAVEKFHATDASGDVISKFKINNGMPDIQLGYLGHVPAISWMDDLEGVRGPGKAKRHTLMVEGEEVSFLGWRVLFHGDAMPMLALHVETNQAVIVPDSNHPQSKKALESVLKYCGKDGILGLPRIVEYVVEKKPKSNKAKNHWVHELDADAEPVLVKDKATGGLLYAKDRKALLGEIGKPVAAYDVKAWFEENDRPHGTKKKRR